MTACQSTLSDAEYVAIEDEIAGTAKGRAFLRHRDNLGRAAAAELVSQTVHTLKKWIAGDDCDPDHEPLEMIRRELKALRAHIDQAKAEIAGLVSDGSPAKVAPLHGATAELDEIVSATAQATHDILTAAEAINGEADGLPNDAAACRRSIVARCMDVYQACSFQDITGQRIAKVVATLAHVEQRVVAMLQIGAGDSPGAAISTSGGANEAATNTEEWILLNGPQLPGQGLDQDTIDALLHGRVLSASGVILPVPPAVGGASAEPLGQNAIDALFP